MKENTIRLLLCLFAGLYASSVWGQDTDTYYRSGTITPLVLFGTFQGVAGKKLTGLQDRELLDNQSVADLLDVTHEGSLAHYFNGMSYGRLTLAPGPAGVPTTWVQSNQSCVENYVNPPSTPPPTPLPCVPNPSCGTNSNGWRPGVSTFVQEVLANADRTIDFGPYDANNDGQVDLVAVITPEAFGNTCDDRNGTVLDTGFSYRTGDTNSLGNPVTVERVITSDYRVSFPFIVGLLAHEYGHVMGLPELFDRSHSVGGDRTAANHSAGIGSWGTMAKGTNGWNHIVRRDGNSAAAVDGPNPMCAWSRIEMGWITDSPIAMEDRLDTVIEDTNLIIHDINSANGKVYKIEVSADEYFLIANRQNTHSETQPTPVGSYYDDYAPARGLAIWHIDENAGSGLDANEDEEHKRVDLECADGLFDMGGFGTTGNSPNSVAGGDNLDYWASDNRATDPNYRTNNNGNFGDDTDLWPITTSNAFTPDSNPSTYGYSGSGSSARQTMFTGIAVRDITQNRNGSVSVKIRFIPSAPEVDEMSLSQGTGTEWNEVSLSWPEPTNASAIDKYQYSTDDRIDEDTDWQEFSSFPTATGTSPVTVTGTITLLATDTKVDYTFHVRAINEKLEDDDPDEVSAPSAPVSFTLDRPGHIEVMATVGDADALHTPPSVDNELTATLSDANVSNWEDEDITVTWQWQRLDPTDEDWTNIDSDDARSDSYMLTTDDVGLQVRSTVSYMDEASDNTDMATSSPVTVNSRPEITTTEEATNPPVKESSPDVIYTYMASDPDDGNMITWSLGGTNKTLFSIDANIDADGVLTFEADTAPDYEDPNTPNSYVVDVIASDGSLSATLTVTVTVEDVDEAGVVTVVPTTPRADGTTSPPRQGEPLTATLTDPDEGVGGISWQWQGREPDGTTGPTLSSTSGSVQSSYTPQAAQVGRVLQAVVHYSDVFGAGKRADSAVTEPVAGVPDAPPHFMPSPGDGQVVLRWDVAANGSPIVRYEVQSRRVADPPQDWSSWAPVSGGSSARDTTVTGLTNGVLYEFAVRAVNGVGAGKSASQPAMPQSGIVRIPLTASGGDGQVTLSWSAPSGTGSVSIHEYQIRRRISDSGQDWSSWAEVSGGTTARDTTVTGLTNGKTYQFQVQAVDSQEARVAVSDVESATPAAVPDAPPHFMPFPSDGQVLLEWEAAANNGSRITRYEIQWRQVSDPAQPWSSWATVSGGRSARDTTVTGLTNGQLHEFAVRAVNGVGNGASISQVAMPRALSLTASGGDGQVGLNWTFSAHSSTIAHYQVRQRISDSGQDWSSWATVPGGTSARDTTVTALTNGTTYQFQAQAIDSQDALISVSNVVSATPQKPSPGPVRNLSAEGGSASGRIAVSWDAPNTGGTPDRYRVEYRQGSAAWQVGCTPRARQRRRSPRRPAVSPPAGRRRGRPPRRATATSGASAARDRRAGRGPVGVVPPSW